MPFKRLRLAQRRKAAGYSQEAFAEAVGVARTTVNRWECAQSEPQPWQRPKIARKLNISIEELGAVLADVVETDAATSRVSVATVEEELLPHVTDIVFGGALTAPFGQRVQDRIPAARQDPPRRVGAEDVTRIEATTSVFREWDNRWGGGLSHTAVIAQLQWVAACATHSICSSLTVKNRLLTALADLAGAAAFLCYDVKHHTQARALWLLGLDASGEAGNVDLVGTTLRQLAHQALHLNHPDEALRLVRLAYATTVHPAHHVSELALAEIAAFEGWCHAAAGKVQPCHRALSRAQEHFDNAQGEQPPPWLAHLDEPELTALRGHSYHVLAYHEPSVADRAANLLRAAVSGRPGDYPRSKTLNLIALSATYFQRGEHIEEGIAIGDQALAGAGTLKSPRALDRLGELRPLTDRHVTTPGVPEFRDRLNLALADA
jgi:transcriptional regulator with XRE-family HTH domain